MNVNNFLATHNVFTFNEFAVFMQTEEKKNSTIYNLLSYHQKRGHIRRIRRGLYCSVPKGVVFDAYQPDPFLITSKLTPDAVIGYRSALYFFGRLHTVPNEFVCLSNKPESKLFEFQDVLYRAVSIPTSLKRKKRSDFGILTIDHLGQRIKITNLERTFVDIFDRPHLCGSWEEIWRSLENIDKLNLSEVFDYACLLQNASAIAKLGFYLETHKEELMVTDNYISELRKYIPRAPVYLEKDKNTPQRLIRGWNLIVPTTLIQRQWEEPDENI